MVGVVFVVLVNGSDVLVAMTAAPPDDLAGGGDFGNPAGEACACGML